MKLTAEKVTETFTSCLFETEADVKDPVMVESFQATFGLNPTAVEAAKADIKEMLAELPDNFFIGKGGGWSFLNVCTDKQGNQWGDHQSAELLMVLGQATGFVKLTVPRQMWDVMPGGMPYYTVDLEGKLNDDHTAVGCPSLD